MASTSTALPANSEREFISSLRDLYSDCPELWKVKSKDYFNRNKNSAALEKIVSALKNKLQQGVQGPRGKKVSGTSTDDIPELSLWDYNGMYFIKKQLEIAQTETSEKQMEFLVPYMANRNTPINVESSQQDETENLTDNDTIHSPSGETPPDEQNEDASEEVDAENVQESSQDTTVQVSARATLKTGKKRNQMETLLQQSLEDHIVRRRQREEERKRKTN
ncbi:hypothetical protein FQA39_LY08540 [Lamprigera yunnana]|nr:hypothetical protein FQA39_LY08540 [Lamprigera yunnana]